ncbi:MAG: SRPBCC family protein [Calothrix sp. SM1_7_51]|nr:SRPBCC family protein [Calothrix sp. SM1_7_51]
MLQFKYSSVIDAPVEVVWKFHERSDILKILTPPWQPIQVVRRDGRLQIGSITEFRLFLGFLPLTWLARHTEYEEFRLFTDEQMSGPFEFWKHKHIFEPEGEKTRLTDEIYFSLPGGDAADLMAGWLVQMQLDAMFRYRHQITKRECERKA